MLYKGIITNDNSTTLLIQLHVPREQNIIVDKKISYNYSD